MKILCGFLCMTAGAFNMALAGLYGNVEYSGPHGPIRPLIIGTIALAIGAACFFAAGRSRDTSVEFLERR